MGNYKPLTLTLTINVVADEAPDAIAMKLVRTAIEAYLDNPIKRVRVLQYCIDRENDLMMFPEGQLAPVEKL